MMGRRTTRHRTTKGSALIAVLIVCSVLAFSVLTTGMLLVQDLEFLGGRESRSRARQMAGKGLAIACCPSVESWDPVLEGGDAQEGFRGSKMGEDRLPNLNALLKPGGREILERLFAAWGLQVSEASALTDALIDWIDEDDLPGLNGAESLAYARIGKSGLPANRPFASLSEVRQVIGISILDGLRPNWESELSVYSSGRLDLSEAGAEAIAAFTGCQMERATAYVTKRRGADGLENTEDDLIEPSLGAILDQLGITQNERAAISSSLGMESQAMRFKGSGWSVDATWKIEVIAQVRDERTDVFRVLEGGNS